MKSTGRPFTGQIRPKLREISAKLRILQNIVEYRRGGYTATGRIDRLPSSFIPMINTPFRLALTAGRLAVTKARRS